MSDRRLSVNDGEGEVAYYEADVVTANDYYPGGMQQPGRSYNTGDYVYGFGGKRKDNEMYGEGNAYDFDARVFDTRVTRWLSVDPLFSSYPHQSPYVTMSNNWLNRIDPSGMGDYYDKDGKRLGSDGKTITVGKGKKAMQVGDDKAYVSSQAIIDQYTKDGKTDWDAVIAASGTSQLSVSNSTLGRFANAIARESSGDMQESYALGSAIVNLSNYKGKRGLATLKSQGIFGYNGKTDFSNSEYSLAAAINALTGGVDYSNGAIRWDGYDLAARGFSHPKPRKETGVEISDEHFNAFKTAWPDAVIKAFSGGAYESFAMDFSSGIHVATEGINKGRCLFKSTAVHGRTMFWGINRDPIILQTVPWRVPMAMPALKNSFGMPPLFPPPFVVESIHVNSGFKNWRGL